MAIETSQKRCKSLQNLTAAAFPGLNKKGEGKYRLEEKKSPFFFVFQQRIMLQDRL